MYSHEQQYEQTLAQMLERIKCIEQAHRDEPMRRDVAFDRERSLANSRFRILEEQLQLLRLQNTRPHGPTIFAESADISAQ